MAGGTLHPVQPLKTDQGVRPYTVRVLRRAGRCECHVSIQVPENPSHAWMSEMLASIDVNPTQIDIAIMHKHGSLIAAKTFKSLP